MSTVRGRPLAGGGMTEMTEGSPALLIVQFSLPLILANTLQQVYSMVDTIILGRFGGVTGLAVLGTCSWPTWLLVSLLTNFSQAASILLANRFGARDTEGFKRVLGNVYGLALVVGMAAMLLFQLSARGMLIMQGTPQGLLADAEWYLRITYFGMPLLFAYNVFAAELRAIGDSAAPLLAIMAATVVNVGLDLWFVAGLGMGAPGAAIATVVAQGVSALICFMRMRRYRVLKTERGHWRFRPELTRRFGALCAPMLMQSFVIAFGGFFVQTAVNSYGETFVAGISATGKVFGLLETAAIALAQATATFVSQNHGARKFPRIHQGVRVSVGISLCLATLLATSMFLLGRRLLGLFVVPEAIEAGWGYLVVMSVGLWIMYPMYVLRQSLQALGNTLIPLAAAVIQLAARVLVTLYLPRVMGSAGLYYPTVAAWASSLVLIGVVFPGYLRRCENAAR